MKWRLRYTNYIKGRDDWEFVSVYTDAGITGTSTKHREGFKRMIADALDGTTFSEKLWCGLLDYATAYADGRLTFTFRNGSTFEG